MAVSRRTFVQAVAAAAAGTLLASSSSEGETPAAPVPATQPTAEAPLRWLEGGAAAGLGGVTFGVPWPRGTVAAKQPLTLQLDGLAVPTQTWPLAYWPDGSLKWSGHAVGTDIAAAKVGRIVVGESPMPASPIRVKDDGQMVEIDTGVIRCRLPRSGEFLIDSILRGDAPIIRNARLVCLTQDRLELQGEGQVSQQAFTSSIEKVTVEQFGPVRGVVRIEGAHVRGDRRWLPFSVRLYFYAGSDAVRLMHSFVFDGNEYQDFIRGLGVRFEVPMRGQLYDRHVRFTGEGDGLWAEAVRNLSGLRRDPGKAFIEKQLAGEACPPIGEMEESVRSRLQYIPAWDGFRLEQHSADSFTIRKKTRGDDWCWIDAGHGGRASGVGYVGTPAGGAAFGIRDFWQKHPSALEIHGASTGTATATMWLWSPTAQPMDLRFYHDGMGQDTHEKQYDGGLEITYEDYEPGFATPHGIARTSEMMLRAVMATPSRQRFTELAATNRAPAALVSSPEHYLKCNVFGGLWSLPDRSTPAKARIEDQLDWYVGYYRTQVEQSHWYGFWDYGDVMHTYDGQRHCWRYDVGGYGWDNSELSPDLWLWYAFLRSGDAATFRFAEAMTRHTGEVDVYHTGPYAMLGSRHNVRHWGDSAKQLRISTPAYRRFYYYLTADERVGDLLNELIDCDQAFMRVDPGRKLRKEEYKPEPHALAVGFGTDWGSIAAAELAAWERTGDTKYRDKLIASMKGIAAMPRGFFTGGGQYDPATGAFAPGPGAADAVSNSHLATLFGLPEMCAELIQLIDVPEFEKAWLQYCQWYQGDRKDRTEVLGKDFKTGGQTNAHSRITAYAAMKLKDAAMAKRAWEEFTADDTKWAKDRYTLKTDHITGPSVLNPIDEARWVGTNDTAQWCLAAIQNLALIGDHL